MKNQKKLTPLIIKVVNLLLAITFFSCSQEVSKLKIHLRELSNLNSQIDTTGWKIIRKYEDIEEEAFELNKEQGNTWKSLIYHYNKDNDSFWIENYLIIIKDDLIHHEISMTNDTLYYFQEPLNNLTRPNEIGDKDFIVGKYNFLFERGLLRKEGQLDYYFEHRDSLSKVRGNDLPELPFK